MSHGQVLVCGLPDTTESLKGLTDGLGLEPRPVQSFAQLTSEGANGASCALVGYGSPDARALCHELRLSKDLVDLPLVAVVDDPWSAEVREAFAAGVDDYVPRQALSQARNKMMALRADGAPTGTYLSGTVLLADPERGRRVNLGRHLKKMGLAVQFAVDDDLPAGPEVKLVVAHCALPPDGVAPALARYRQGPGKLIPWIITGSSADLSRAKDQLSGHEKVAYCDLEADSAQVVFAANKVLIGTGRSLRRSERLVYETPVHVTIPESGVEIWGYTYNINLGGLYIRTLTPPALGTELTLEFSPPHGRGRVVVDAKVVWRQEYSPGKGYPAGCGVQYLEQENGVADRAALDAGYQQLLEETGGEATG